MMSPLMRARFHRFRQNKLGVRCLILFLIIFILSLFAELIANDINCKSVPYLADVAQLEWLRIGLYHALDETPLSTTEVQIILTTNINQLMDCSIQMLTASDILNSQFNTASIWSLHQQYDAATQSAELENALLELDLFQPQSMLIWRNEFTIEVIPIELSTGHFLSELKKGQTIFWKAILMERNGI